MKLLLNDMVTGEIIPIECEPADTIQSIKYQFLMYQSLSLSIADLHMDVVHNTNTKEDTNEKTEFDTPASIGTLEELCVQEGDLLLFIYTLGA